MDIPAASSTPEATTPGSVLRDAGPDPGLPPAMTPMPYSDDVAAKMSGLRRWVILFVVCWMALPVTFMSTSIMTVNPEIAATFGVQTTSISTANAGVLVGMAMSALIWLPITTIIGRRSSYLVASVLFVLCSLGCALSNSFPLFTALWVFSGTMGPFFLVAGQTILSDIFEPVSRRDCGRFVDVAKKCRLYVEPPSASSSAALSARSPLVGSLPL